MKYDAKRFAIQIERGYFYLRIFGWEFERITQDGV